MSFPPDFAMFTSDVPNSATHIGGPGQRAPWCTATATGSRTRRISTTSGRSSATTEACGRPRATGSLPGGSSSSRRTASGGCSGHPYNTTSNYTFFTFAKFSPDGKYVLFTSDMNGSGRSDVFLAELPQTGAGRTPPIPRWPSPPPPPGPRFPASRERLANASDNVGVAGVQFQLDGGNLGAEDTSAPFGVVWNTRRTPNGSHTLTAVARDAAGNTTTSAARRRHREQRRRTRPAGHQRRSGASEILSTARHHHLDHERAGGLPGRLRHSPPPTAPPRRSAPALVLSHSQTTRRAGPGDALPLPRPLARRRRQPDRLAETSPSPPCPRHRHLIAHLEARRGNRDHHRRLLRQRPHRARCATARPGPPGATGLGRALDGVDDYVGVAHAADAQRVPAHRRPCGSRPRTTSGVSGLVNKYVASSYNGYQIFFENGSLCAWYHEGPRRTTSTTAAAAR